MATLSLIAKALARGVAPDPIVDAVQWACDHLVVADGPAAGNKWDITLTPQLGEILRLLSPESPHNRISVRKSGQVGMTQVGIAWLAEIVSNFPAHTLVVFPTTNAVQDFNRTKLQPTIEATPRLRMLVREQKSRSGAGSTTLNKKFPGGSMVLTGANSAADLRSKTVKFLFCDEVDEWPTDLDGQGDPMEMADARQIAFHATGDYKKFECSTPTIKGASRIDAAFEAGDQRYWFVPCPECGEFQRLRFQPVSEGRGGLIITSQTYPYNAKYACEHCGCLIEQHQKRRMIQAGEWRATCPGAGRHPSFHLDAVSSLLTTWDKIAEKWIESKDDPRKLKTFLNLWLGEPWEERGEAPEWQRLFARREDYELRTIPQGGLLITAGADVQKDGIYYETVAWGAGKTSWSIDFGFLPGDTADTADRCWTALSEVYERKYVDFYSNRYGIDLFAIDGKYNTAQACEWARRHPLSMPIQGQPGWYHPPLGTPKKQDINWQGQKKRRGATLWPVGTWPLKSELYANLRKRGIADGEQTDPPGFCHFSESHDQRYFQQLVAEHIKERTVKSKGVKMREWVKSGDNHLHDCRIYAMAMAYHLGIGTAKDEDWIELARQRQVPQKNLQVDLFDRMGRVVEMKEPKAPSSPPKHEKRREADWIPDRDWN
jgi:phage terminase large subunit GpA-like protein